MYALLRNQDGTHYGSVVFGLSHDVPQKPYGDFCLVLNQEKTVLVKKYAFQQETGLDLKVVITDGDKTGWIRENEYKEIQAFLKGADLSQAEISLPRELLERCIQMDREYVYQEYPEIRCEKDIDDLMWASGCFHDGEVAACTRQGEDLYVLFTGIWGCKIEMWFEGDADYCLDTENIGTWAAPYFLDSSFFREGDYYYLAEDEKQSSKDFTPEDRWFRGKRVRYHVIPYVKPWDGAEDLED